MQADETQVKYVLSLSLIRELEIRIRSHKLKRIVQLLNFKILTRRRLPK